MEATLVWMSERPLRAGRPYLLKHATQTVRARVREDLRQIDVATLAEAPAATLSLNEIGRAAIVTERPLFFDPYRTNRATGSLILIDPITNETVAAGMIAGAAAGGAAAGRVTAEERQARHGHRAAVIVVESDETALMLERKLFDAGILAVWAEGETPARSLYESGAVVILSGVPELTGWAEGAVRFPEDEARNPHLLVERIRRMVGLR